MILIFRNVLRITHRDVKTNKKSKEKSYFLFERFNGIKNSKLRANIVTTREKKGDKGTGGSLLRIQCNLKFKHPVESDAIARRRTRRFSTRGRKRCHLYGLINRACERLNSGHRNKIRRLNCIGTDPSTCGDLIEGSKMSRRREYIKRERDRFQRFPYILLLRHILRTEWEKNSEVTRTRDVENALDFSWEKLDGRLGLISKKKKKRWNAKDIYYVKYLSKLQYSFHKVFHKIFCLRIAFFINFIEV